MNSSSLAFHLSAYYGQVTSVVDNIMPIMFQNLFHLNVLGIHHQSTCFSVQAMHHMSRTVEMSLTEIFIEDSLYTELAWVCSHAQDTWSLLDYYNILVLIYNLHMPVVEFRTALVTTDANGLTGMQRMVETCYQHTINAYAMSLEQILYMISAYS